MPRQRLLSRHFFISLCSQLAVIHAWRPSCNYERRTSIFGFIALTIVFMPFIIDSHPVAVVAVIVLDCIAVVLLGISKLLDFAAAKLDRLADDVH